MCACGRDEWWTRVAARTPGQVIAHYVHNHGGRHQRDGGPKPPITMCVFPVRAMEAVMSAARYNSVPVAVALYFSHLFRVFSNRFRMIASWR